MKLDFSTVQTDQNYVTPTGNLKSARHGTVEFEKYMQIHATLIVLRTLGV